MPFPVQKIHKKIDVVEVKTDDLIASTQVIGTTEIEDDAINTAKILDASVTIAKVESAILQGQVATGQISIDSSEVWYVPMNVKCEINTVKVVLTTTSDATASVIQMKDATGGDMANGSATLSSGDAIGTIYTITPTSSQDIAADASAQIVSDASGTTGAIYAVIQYTKKE